MRRIIDVPEEMLRSLDAIAGSEKRSRTSVVREALAEYLRHKGMPPADAAFGPGRSDAKDAIRHGDRLRDEWERVDR